MVGTAEAAFCMAKLEADQSQRAVVNNLDHE